ncbi:hypothetical protein MKEN_00844100 [Mycena kentingensis (nom. inval.)]|nr:hypothetical protein MKEN_00844100 [Mycena kentingensis (nom. inval.)]
MTMLLFSLLALLPNVLAHGGVLSYDIGSTHYQGWTPYNSPSLEPATIQRPWLTYDPILDATDPNIACNDDGTGAPQQLTAAPVPAGTAVKAYYNQVWPHPYGPMLTYLAQCPGSTCTGVQPRTLKWFKIDQSGLISGTIFNGTWGSGKMIAQNSTWTSVIPPTVPAGNYLIRFETIALHSLPAQFYPECAQIQISAGPVPSVAPTAAQLVTFPGGYSNSDPGLTTNLYSNEAQTTTTYPIPGPPLYGASSGSSGTTRPVTTVTTRPVTTATTRPATTTSSAPTGGS